MFCLLAAVMFSPAKADCGYSMFFDVSEAFVQNAPDIDFVGSIEISDTNENEEDEETESDHFYLNSSQNPFPLSACQSNSVLQSKKNLHQLIINLFTNLPPPLSDNCQYL